MDSQINLNFDKQLLDLSYQSAIALLLKKYGRATEDYFKEKSYEKLLAGEIQYPNKGRIARTQEGLYCHHQAEDRYLNMASAEYIISQGIPFEYQTAGHLVYCNLVEHAVLHTLIAKRTNGQFGLPGLVAYLLPEIKDWYLNGREPILAWQKACFNKAFLNREDTISLIEKMVCSLSF